jgi:quercetin dioxygenase-like cupin family protein
MTPPRRIVTGHDADGRSVVSSDGPLRNARTLRPGHESFMVWSTESVPVDTSDTDDGADRAVGRSLPDGTVFRVTTYEPGVESAPHETDSVDYAVVISGEIDMVLDEQTVHLRVGDVVVQRGTRHDWRNNGSQPCVIAFCLVGATPRS